MFSLWALLLFVVSSTPQSTAKPPLEFPVACSASAQQRFLQGVIKLHNSAYDEAATHFRAAQTADPKCLMAFWGEAMTFNHPFWDEQDLAGGRRALAKLGTTQSARSSRATNARERGYLGAVEILYGDGDKTSRDLQYASAMQKLAVANPTDFEASAFYAAALLGSVRPGDPDASKQTTAASIVKAVLAKYPNHPGALHYFIHASDDPDRAEQALAAARLYEKIADDNFHAMHMPSHIYVQLGMWTEAARSNEAAYAASDRYVQRNKLSADKRDYHSLDWLQYVDMQLGQYQKARSRIDTVLHAAHQAAMPRMNGMAAEMASRFAVETEQWDALSPFPQVSRTPKLLFAFGLSAVRKGDVTSAKAFVPRLDALVQEAANTGLRTRSQQVDVLKKELAAEIAFAEKRFDDAEQWMREAVAIEAALKIPSVLEQGGILKSAPEFYGDLLIRMGKPAQAIDQFKIALQRTRKRALSLLGLARAHAKQGNKAAATQFYRELSAIWTNADSTIPAVREVRAGIGALE